MKKIIDLIKKNYKVFLASLVVLILLVILIIIGFKAKDNSTKYTLENQGVYQYLDNHRVDYSASITLSNESGVVSIKTDNEDSVIDSSPLYYNDIDVAIFPIDMIAVFPLDNVKQQRVPFYTKIDSQSSIYKELKYQDKVYDLDHAFLYDGNDLYFFIEETTLTYGDKSIKLNPMSFVIYNNLSNILSYYNYKDNAYLVESVTDDVTATTKDYEINLKIDGVKKGSDYRLLIKSADILNSLF